MLGIGGGTGSTINQLMNNSSSPNNITRNESNTSGGNLLFAAEQVNTAKENAEGNEVAGQFNNNENEELGFEE